MEVLRELSFMVVGSTDRCEWMSAVTGHCMFSSVIFLNLHCKFVIVMCGWTLTNVACNAITHSCFYRSDKMNFVLHCKNQKTAIFKLFYVECTVMQKVSVYICSIHYHMLLLYHHCAKECSLSNICSLTDQVMCSARVCFMAADLSICSDTLKYHFKYCV